MAIILGGTQDPYLESSTSFGPFTRTNDTGVSFTRRVWYRQKPITSRPLQYDLDTYGRLPGSNNTFGYRTPPRSANWTSSLYQNTLAKARERFNAKLGDKAGLGVDLAEWGQSLSMIETRATQLWKFSKALKRGRFGDAYKVIRGRVPRDPPKGLHKGKSFASNFLEWHFGWSPLVADIYDACNVLQSPISSTRIRARASSDVTRSFWYDRNDSSVVWSEEVIERYQVALGAEVFVSNPNLRLASQLGLVNPAVLAWEVVPFSFVVDWFVPVGDFLSQWTDFVGLTLDGAYTTSGWRMDYYDRYDLNPKLGSRHDRNFIYRFTLTRRKGISSYRLAATRFSGFSAMRGLTAVSLLIQQLRKP